jgi:hypothetical protein
MDDNDNQRNNQDQDVNTNTAPDQQPYNQDEQSVSGATPDLESDDDTLANAQAAGTQLDETEENPKELDIGSDVDKAEEYHRTH